MVQANWNVNGNKQESLLRRQTEYVPTTNQTEKEVDLKVYHNNEDGIDGYDDFYGSDGRGNGNKMNTIKEDAVEEDDEDNVGYEEEDKDDG